MMGFILGKLGIAVVSSAITMTMDAAIVAMVLWLLKKIPNEVIKAKFGKLMFALGVACTLGISTKYVTGKAAWAKKVWDVVEYYILDFVENIIVYGIAEWVRGMRSDNKIDKGQTELKTPVKVRR